MVSDMCLQHLLKFEKVISVSISPKLEQCLHSWWVFIFDFVKIQMTPH